MRYTHKLEENHGYCGQISRRTGNLISASAGKAHMWSVEEQPNHYVVRDANRQQLAYVYFVEQPGRRSAAMPSPDGRRVVVFGLTIRANAHRRLLRPPDDACGGAFAESWSRFFFARSQRRCDGRWSLAVGVIGTPARLFARIASGFTSRRKQMASTRTRIFGMS
jgi:hypothetical protein